MPALIVWILSAVCFDLKTFRIPNRLILLGVLLGELWLLLPLLLPGNTASVLQVLFLLCKRTLQMVCLWFLLYPLWRIRCIGGGDVKLMGVEVLFIGMLRCINSFAYACICCLILSLMQHLGHRFFAKSIPGLRKKDGFHQVHFSLPLLCGLVAEMLLGDLLFG